MIDRRKRVAFYLENLSSGITNRINFVEWQKVAKAVHSVSPEPWTLEERKYYFEHPAKKRITLLPSVSVWATEEGRGPQHSLHLMLGIHPGPNCHERLCARWVRRHRCTCPGGSLSARLNLRPRSHCKPSCSIPIYSSDHPIHFVWLPPAQNCELWRSILTDVNVAWIPVWRLTSENIRPVSHSVHIWKWPKSELKRFGPI